MPGGIGTVPVDDAVRRVVAFCTAPSSGWHTYDMLGAQARQRGHFAEIAPWSLLWADTLAGRLSVADISGFTHELRPELAHRLEDIPPKPLARMDDTELEKLTFLCRFGFPGVWALKITKMLALYRPEAVPVLDGYVAVAMGFTRNGFSVGRERRWARIHATLRVLRRVLRDQQPMLTEVRRQVRRIVPDIVLVTELRLLDIIVWTSQDDRLPRPGSPANFWLTGEKRDYKPLCVDPIPLGSQAADLPRHSIPGHEQR